MCKFHLNSCDMLMCYSLPLVLNDIVAKICNLVPIVIPSGIKWVPF